MTNKAKFKNVLFWIMGTVVMGLGIALCTKGGLGLSMIAAPPYIIHVWLRDTFAWFTQGTAEYFWQAIILIIMCLIIRRFRWRYLLSFVAAMLSGFVIDFWLMILGGNGCYESMAVRIAAFIIGTCVTGFAVACFFRTTLPIQVYELTVNEITARYNFDKIKVKRIFDATMLVLAVGLALLLNHSLEGVGIGTIITTIINASVIKFFGKVIDGIEGK
ncbi:MAG: hypothetical protein KBS79_02265 [Lachnospiraceae bacterium]|nr:hypothetical protein [Candidatus Minthocola equi]